MIESREGCGPLELTRRRRGQIPLRTTLSQIPLKSCGFPGAESARKRFFLRGQAPPAKKSAPGGDQPKSSISLGRSRSDLLALWASNLSAAQVAGLDWKSRGFTPSRALPWAVLVEKLVPDEAGYSFEGFCFRRRGRGALRSPTPPRATGCERVATLSRSPGAVLMEILVSDEAGCSFVGVVSDDTGVGRSAPLHPLG